MTFSIKASLRAIKNKKEKAFIVLRLKHLNFVLKQQYGIYYRDDSRTVYAWAQKRIKKCTSMMAYEIHEMAKLFLDTDFNQVNHAVFDNIKNDLMQNYGLSYPACLSLYRTWILPPLRWMYEKGAWPVESGVILPPMMQLPQSQPLLPSQLSQQQYHHRHHEHHQHQQLPKQYQHIIGSISYASMAAKPVPETIVAKVAPTTDTSGTMDATIVTETMEMPSSPTTVEFMTIVETNSTTIPPSLDHIVETTTGTADNQTDNASMTITN